MEGISFDVSYDIEKTFFEPSSLVRSISCDRGHTVNTRASQHSAISVLSNARKPSKPVFRYLTKQINKCQEDKSSTSSALLQYSTLLQEATTKLLNIADPTDETPELFERAISKIGVKFEAPNEEEPLAENEYRPTYLEKQKKNSPMLIPNQNRSFSEGNVLADSPVGTKTRRYNSLRELRSPQSKRLSMSPLLLGSSVENLSCLNEGHYSQISPRNNVLKRKKKFASLIRKNSQNRDENEKRSEKIDNKHLENLIINILTDYTRDMVYDPEKSRERCRDISVKLKETVRELMLGIATFKVTAEVFMGEIKDHGMGFATQCTYDPVQDLFATSTIQKDIMFVCGIVTAGRCI